jgi:hypothetical protein
MLQRYEEEREKRLRAIEEKKAMKAKQEQERLKSFLDSQV